ncbi:DNA adenine methylase [candidate division MSBL1 archaeon SCGC-AAA833F18]|uniref:site-specific DNA-methyltransferase (adenine-specific) n=1 Tax=candidate division MSBL1 archaeon SCGC-AAA833F18 TaxID=1698257 RepID=A0A133VSB1_9EURY|nr:DNA adenine methylase [candidate division MSBL1 archaeon SCGC-AAA833F18]
MVDPILKWAGGKRQLLDDIVSLFPKDYQDRAFHEPMFGGGAVTFHVGPSEGTINDIVPRLMIFYEVVRDNPEELIEESRKLEEEYGNNEKKYYEARDEFNKPIRGEKLDKVREASLLLYLNRTCFNGLYRENSKGEFNVPFGDYSNPDFVREKQIRECSKILKNLEILNEDFEYIIDKAKPGDLVYFDPPYQPVSETADFTQYAKEGFDFSEQERLRDTCVKLDKNDVFFVLSNSWAEPVRELYEEVEKFEVNQVSAKRDISSKAETRGPVYEILVTNVSKELQRGKSQKKLASYG